MNAPDWPGLEFARLDWPRVVILLVAAQRLLELALARRNTRRLLAAGGREIGAGHYPALVGLHALWILTLLVLTPPGGGLALPWMAAFVGLQCARVWVIVSLGRYWTTRIITLDSAPLVRRGPFRWVRHPNYLIVAAELLVLPLALGQPAIGIAFLAFNLPITLHRIKVEESALSARRSATDAGVIIE